MRKERGGEGKKEKIRRKETKRRGRRGKSLNIIVRKLQHTERRTKSDTYLLYPLMFLRNSYSTYLYLCFFGCYVPILLAV